MPSPDGRLGAEPLDSLVILHLLTAEEVPARKPPPKVPHDAAMARRKPGAHDRHRLSLLVDERDALLAELRSAAEARDRAERDRDEVLARLYRSQSAEREHLARELHDEVGQQLAWLTLNLKRLSTSPSVKQDVEASLAQVEAIAASLRRVVHDLRPASLSERGLTLALGSFVREWSDRSGITVDFQLSGTTVALAPEIEVTIFRLVQEALTNVLKHAPATRQVSITLHFGRVSVALTLEDDGPGLAPEGIPESRPGTGGFGLPGMRERLALLGGDLVIESTPGRGVTLLARVPVRSD